MAEIAAFPSVLNLLASFKFSVQIHPFLIRIENETLHLPLSHMVEMIGHAQLYFRL